MLPIPFPGGDPVTHGIVYGITRALGEVWSRIAGVKSQWKLEREMKEKQFWMQVDKHELDKDRLAMDHQHHRDKLVQGERHHDDNLAQKREQWQEHIALEREKMHAHAVQRVAEIKLSAEVAKIYEHHPIRLTPGTFQRSYAQGRVPLHIVLVPPKGPGGVEEMRRLLPEIEDELLGFIQDGYHAGTSPQPAKLLTETWIAGRPCGSSAVQGLFGLLEGVPMLIVEAVALTDGLSFRIGFWGLEQSDSSYARIGTVPWAALALDPAKIPADPAARDAALRAETLIAAERLLPWYKLVLAVTLDQFHLIQSGAKPSLPSRLQSILGVPAGGGMMSKLASAFMGSAGNQNAAFEPVIQGMLEAYRQVYAAYAIAHGALAPDLMLDLADSLAAAGRMGEARTVAGDAERAWLGLHGNDGEGDRLALLERLATEADIPLLERLASVWRAAGDADRAARLLSLALRVRTTGPAPAARPRLTAPGNAAYAPSTSTSRSSSRSPGTVFREIEAPWCPEMVAIPEGQFTMGSPPDEAERTDAEGPQRRVVIEKPFALGKYVVTGDEFHEFVVDAGYGHDPPAPWGRGRMPVVNVSWEDAKAYCKWLSGKTKAEYRLPSEAEWEYACRAGTSTAFSFGPTVSTDQANYDGNSTYANGRKGAYRQKTVPVDEFRPNAFGLHQMHGNVWEWCEDSWHDSYVGAPRDGSVWLFQGNLSSRVVRGGSWLNYPGRLRAAFRIGISPGVRNYDLGFRLSRMLTL